MKYFIPKNNPVFFIAEIGGNHEGDFEYAKKLLSLAIKSGADAVKFQIYTGDTLVSKVESPDRNRHFKRFELSIEQYIELATICKQHDTLFMASIWDTDILSKMNPYISIHKVGSGDLTAFPLIKELVSTGKPIILSTGLCTIDEIRAVVQYISDLDEKYISMKKLALLQCTTAYPCPDEDVHLNAMTNILKTFGLPVGYSDHTIGNDAVQTAVAMGAKIVEMHFTDNRENKKFRDHLVSATCNEVQELLINFRKIIRFQGSSIKKPTHSEISSGHLKSFRRSIYASVKIKKGDLLSEKNMTILRPGIGIPASRYYEILGKKASRDINFHNLITESDIE